MTYDELLKKVNEGELFFHHSATRNGYVSRRAKEPIVKEYKGMFGTGYTVHFPNYNSTSYHYIHYYIIPR